MKKICVPALTVATALAIVFALSLPAHAQGAAELFKAKCVMCHGADGKRVAGHDLQSAGVRKKSDADLASVITDGKAPKMPAHKSLTPEEVQGLVAYIRSLKNAH